ncbi:MAG: TAXI family TRAP transporter solute-binding subunit [Candidatus Bathyarchaeia archaeon]
MFYSQRAITKVQAIVLVVVIVVVVVAGVSFIFFRGAPAPSRKEIRVGGATPGSTGYILGSLVADVLRSTFTEYGISFYAVGGATANTKEFIAGGLELSFATAGDTALLYRRELWYKDVSPDVIKPVHTLYLCTALHIIVTTPELKEKYHLNSWKDLDNKKVCYFSSKYENYHWITRALDNLGVRWIHVETDWDLVPDALKKEDIVAVMISTTGGVPPPWCISVATKLKVVIIPPSSGEISAIEKIGGSYGWFSTESFKKAGVDVAGLDRTFGVVLALGWNTNPKYMSEDEVYKLLKELIRRKDDLAKMTAYMQEFAADPIGLQVRGISLAPDVPVHPGLAKLLKEYGAWNEAWRIASG